MTVRREATLKGQWYPQSGEACVEEMDRFLREGWIRRPKREVCVAGIVPHAGWHFSGSIACRVVESLSQGEKPDLVVLFGHHLGPYDPTCVMTEGLLETPLGDLEVHRAFARALGEYPYIRRDVESFLKPENTLEIQLPFVRRFFGEIPVCLIAPAPNRHAEDVGRAVVATALEMDLSIRMIGSTDLTHYGPDFDFTPKGGGEEARAWVESENDREAIKHMLALEPAYFTRKALSRSNACCAGAVASTLAAVKSQGGESGELLAYTSSFYKSSSESFVGYAGVVY
ncbi:MAG: AmmeMemoRadiSam system protein B [Desulfobacterales bacterium]|nr:AmmeMemoRadiSam system protein B [Desulfobacterales bacterium]